MGAQSPDQTKCCIEPSLAPFIADLPARVITGAIVPDSGAQVSSTRQSFTNRCASAGFVVSDERGERYARDVRKTLWSTWAPGCSMRVLIRATPEHFETSTECRGADTVFSSRNSCQSTEGCSEQLITWLPELIASLEGCQEEVLKYMEDGPVPLCLLFWVKVTGTAQVQSILT